MLYGDVTILEGETMKKRYKVLILIVLILLFWVGNVCYCGILTKIHGDEFVDFNEVGFDYLHPWEGTPKLRVMSCSSNEAKVYFYKETGGEKVLFIKQDDKWKYEKTIAIWTSAEQGGNATDYFIWPYFKNYVP